MKLQKQVLREIEKCYSALGLFIGGEPHLFFAGEGNGSVHVFHGKSFDRHITVTEGGGGTMSIVAVPGREGWVMISRGFYSMVESQGSVIELIRHRDGAFAGPEQIAALPYLHRFGLVSAPGGAIYLIAATIADYKRDKEDWEYPGHLYYALLPDCLDNPFELEFIRLPGDYYINHGFCVSGQNDREAAYIGCREGAFRITPPEQRGGDFNIERLLDIPISDVAVCDIDGDGEDEIAALLPFHGDRLKLFKRVGGSYREVYSYPVENDFYHAILGAEIGGEKVFVAGARRIAAQLLLIRWDKKSRAYVPQVIDEGVGPSNAAVLNTPERDILLSANRQINQAAIYVFDNVAEGAYGQANQS